MLKNSRWLVLFGIATLLFLVAKACSPVPIPLERNCRVFKGTLTKIATDGTNDIFFNFDNSEKLFYINRGLEKGLKIESLKDQLVGQEVVIKYPRYWTPLDPLNHVRQVSKLEFQDSTIYSELRSVKKNSSPTI